MKPPRMTSLFLVGAAAGWLFAGTALAVEADKLFDTANKLYEERKYPEAAAVYETILDAGQTSPAIYFNLGNAHFKASQNGRAILAYLRAAQLTPRDPDIRANLQFARNQVQGPTLRPTRLQRVFNTLSLDEWATLGVIGLWATFLQLALAQLRPVLKASLRTFTVLAGAATLLLAACLIAAISLNGAGQTVIVTRPSVAVRNGPLSESATAFTAQDGAELRILDHKDDWVQVTDGTRRAGWVQRAEVSPLP